MSRRRRHYPTPDGDKVTQEEILATEKRLLKGQETILEEESEILRRLKHLEHRVTGFLFRQSGVAAMNLNLLAGLAPGTQCTVSVVPVDSNGATAPLPSGIVPVWTRSNDQIHVVPADDGLSAQVSVDTSAAPDAAATLTVAYPDGSVTSSAGFPIDPNPAPPVGAVAGFSFTQSDATPIGS